MGGQKSEGSHARDPSDPYELYYRFVGTTSTDGGNLRIALPRSVVVTPDPRGEIGRALQSFDGFHSVKDVLTQFAEIEPIRQAIADAIDVGALRLTEELAVTGHLYGNNPMPFASSASVARVVALSRERRALATGKPIVVDDLDRLFADRKSCRSFEDRSLSWEEIGQLIDRSMYFSTGAAPSAGALYPLTPYVIKRADRIWQVARRDLQTHRFDMVNPAVSTQSLQYIFDSQQIVHGASGILVLMADFQVCQEKYSNRGYRYALTEAGHVSQSFMLRATHDGYASCEWGAYLDEPLKNLLNTETQSSWPAVAVGFGCASNVRSEEAMLNELHQQLFFATEQSDDINWLARRHPLLPSGRSASLVLSHLSYKRPFEAEPGYASGVARSSKLADVRAMAEAVERVASSRWRAHRRCPEIELHNPAFIPSSLLADAEDMGWGSDSSTPPIDWIDGRRSNGQPVSVPSELVFYGSANPRAETRRFRRPTSSGVAAHKDYDTAKQGALLELIERDAFLRSWTGVVEPVEWQKTNWPSWFSSEVPEWETSGVEVQVLVLRSDIPTVLVALHASQWPALAVGASSKLDPDDALEKAWIEAAAGWLVGRTLDRNAVPDRLAVKRPSDHAYFYCDPQNAEKIRGFFSCPSGEAPKRATSVHLDGLADENDVAYVDISLPEPTLSVVRALSSSFMPLEFGVEAIPRHLINKTWLPSQNPHPFP